MKSILTAKEANLISMKNSNGINVILNKIEGNAQKGLFYISVFDIDPIARMKLLELGYCIKDNVNKNVEIIFWN